MSFVRAPNPIWYLPDLTGAPLNDEYFAFFLTNTLPYLPQNVYRDNQGQTVWTGDVIQFFPNGTLPDNLYFDPNLVYRIEVRHGNSQFDELIYEINDFVPDEGQTIITETSLLTNENQITNPTFSEVSFSTTLTDSTPTLDITAAGTYEIAPGWELVLTGAGTTTLTQIIWSADQNITGNPVPAYALRIDNAGWTTATLRQRFNRNGGIWTNGAVAMSFVAMAHATPVVLSMSYDPESPGIPVPVINTVTVPTGIYTVFSAAANTGQSTNSNLNNISFVDIDITLPVNGSFDISDIQVVGQTTPLASPSTAPLPEFQQITEERMVDHLFHFYADSLINQPKDSILTAWNFSLNPWQFTTPVVTNIAVNQYTADQTIIVQQAYVASATGNNIAVGRGTNANNFALQVNAVTATNQFAAIQFIDPATIRPYWGKILSSMVKARIVTGHGTSLAFKMRLIYRSGLPPTVSQTTPIATWTTLGEPVFAAGYTAIAPENDPVFILDSATEQSFSFDKFTLPASNNDSMTLGIVIYSINAMDQTATADTVFIDDISLVNNDFALATQPQTFDDVLRQCEYYYEKSFIQADIPSTNPATVVGERSAPMRVSYVDDKLYLSSFELIYNSVKRANPTLTFWSPTGAINNLQAHIFLNGVDVAGSPVNEGNTQWTETGKTPQSVFMRCVASSTAIVNGDGNAGNEGVLTYQYTADSRLGI